MKAELLSPVDAELGESPVWRRESGDIFWVDILRGDIHRLMLDGEDQIAATFEEPVGALVLGPNGEVVAATPRGLVRLDGSTVTSLERDSDDLRMNDGKADPAGRFVGGTMTIGSPRPGAGSLWRFDELGTSRLVSDATIPNGLSWSADGETFYWIDTPTGRIDAFDYDPATGELSDRRAWASIPEEAGAPDGMCGDVEGGLWVALWGGSAVHRYVAGRLDAVVEVEASLVTCPAFVGPELDQLVITTASVDSPPGEQGAGDIFTIQLGVKGVPVHRLGSWAR